jgi:leucyl-tRNA synthetase
MSAVYNHKTVEKKWQQVWQDEKPLLQLMIIQNQSIMHL